MAYPGELVWPFPRGAAPFTRVLDFIHTLWVHCLLASIVVSQSEHSLTLRFSCHVFHILNPKTGPVGSGHILKSVEYHSTPQGVASNRCVGDGLQNKTSHPVLPSLPVTFDLLSLFYFWFTIYLVFPIKIARVRTLPDVKNIYFEDLLVIWENQNLGGDSGSS